MTRGARRARNAGAEEKADSELFRAPRPGCNETSPRTVLHKGADVCARHAPCALSRCRRPSHPVPGASMFAVIRRYNTHEGTAEKIVQRVREGFIPLVSKLPGFVSYDVVRSPDGGLVSMSVFESREAAEASNRL